jgi:hypothetical protein
MSFTIFFATFTLSCTSLGFFISSLTVSALIDGGGGGYNTNSNKKKTLNIHYVKKSLVETKSYLDIVKSI